MAQTDEGTTRPGGKVLGVRDVIDLEAWVNPRFREELQQDPNAAMAALAEKYGLDLPTDIEYRAVVDTESVCHVVVSANPAGEAPAAEESEVMGYVQQFAVSGTRGNVVAAAPSSSTLFCNPHICSAVNPLLCPQITTR